MGNRLIHARAETVAEHASFWAALTRHWCLVLADGSYEWRWSGNRRIPMRIVMKSEKPFAFAHLWNARRDPKVEIVGPSTIVTLLWRAFGKDSRRNRSITVNMEAERQEFERLQHTSEVPITGSADRQGIDS